MNRPVDIVTLTRADLADLFQESGRRMTAGEFVVPDLTGKTQAERALAAADHIFELATLQAAGGPFDPAVRATHYAQRQALIDQSRGTSE